jgi:UDP-N-acetylmuramoyl-tripeptide--D-alanyl-D-alanine ligase
MPNDDGIDPVTLAGIVQGRWESPPGAGWRFPGLTYYPARPEPGRMALIKSGALRYGFSPDDLERVAGPTGGAGVIAADNVALKAPGWPVLRVEDPRAAIRQLAAEVRRRAPATCLAVTGSVGKTSSCSLARHLLARLGRVRGNADANYADGVLCEVANMMTTDFTVLEVAQAATGPATQIAHPDAALLVNVSPAHMDYHADLLALSLVKARIFRGLRPGGTAVIPRDAEHYPEIRAVAAESGARIVTFGEHPEADFHLTGYDHAAGRVEARAHGETIRYGLGLPGRHMALNSLGVLAALEGLGIDRRGLLERCATAAVPKGRGRATSLRLGKREITLLDDAHNAQPAAMAAAFALLGATAPGPGGRRIALLADMAELGTEAARYHRDLAGPLREAGIDRVYLAGPMMRHHLAPALPAGLVGACTARATDLLPHLVRDLRDCDLVLAKGSHGSRMADLVRYLLALHTVAPGAPTWLYTRGRVTQGRVLAAARRGLVFWKALQAAFRREGRPGR